MFVLCQIIAALISVCVCTHTHTQKQLWPLRNPSYDTSFTFKIASTDPNDAKTIKYPQFISSWNLRILWRWIPTSRQYVALSHILSGWLSRIQIFGKHLLQPTSEQNREAGWRKRQKAPNRWYPSVETQSSSGRICGGKSSTGTDFSQRNSVLLCWYHYTIVPYL